MDEPTPMSDELEQPIGAIGERRRGRPRLGHDHARGRRRADPPRGAGTGTSAGAARVGRTRRRAIRSGSCSGAKIRGGLQSLPEAHGDRDAVELRLPDGTRPHVSVSQLRGERLLDDLVAMRGKRLGRSPRVSTPSSIRSVTSRPAPCAASSVMRPAREPRPRVENSSVTCGSERLAPALGRDTVARPNVLAEPRRRRCDQDQGPCPRSPSTTSPGRPRLPLAIVPPPGRRPA